MNYPHTADVINPTVSPYENEIASGRGLTTIKKTDIGPAHVLRTNTRPPLGEFLLLYSVIPKFFFGKVFEK